MLGLPAGALALLVITILVFLGITHRVLDRMRLTDSQALVVLLALVAGTFLPAIRVTRTVSIDVGGAIAPLAVGIYLIATAGTAKERARGMLAALLTGAVLIVLDRVLTPEPGTRPSIINVDPVWLPGIVAAIIGYLAGRSRRAAFIGGTMGVVISDIATSIQNALARRAGTIVVIGGAGAVDAVIIAGVLSVALAELVGETLEFVSGGPSRRRPAPLLRGLQNADNLRAGAGGSRLRGLISGVTTAIVLVAVLAGSNVLSNVGQGEGPEGSTYRILDRQGALITEIGMQVYRGDEYLTRDDTLYHVFSVKGRDAWAISRGRLDVAAEIARIKPPPKAQAPGGQPVLIQAPGPIAVYHSHNDESYVTNEGVSNLEDGPGGIHRVGDAFVKALRSNGLLAVKSDNLHYPHDWGAYLRSRRTALDLLIWRPAAVFDIHRDATPQETYASFVDGQWVTRVRLVVGTQNPGYLQNRAFAVALKDIGERQHPGLMQGIYFGQGNYNQDLYPRAMLLEIGSHTNAEESAMRGVTLFATAVATFFGVK